MGRKKKAVAAVAAVAVAGLPAGFVNTTGGDFPEAWTPEVGDTLRGLCMGKRTIDAKKAGRQKAKKGETVTIVTIADADGVMHGVWESKALEPFCKEIMPGDEAFLRYDALKKIGKKRFKAMTAAIKKKK